MLTDTVSSMTESSEMSCGRERRRWLAELVEESSEVAGNRQEAAHGIPRLPIELREVKEEENCERAARSS